MALEKEIELENGIKVSYHRIVSVTKITNNQTIIEVASYTSQEKREEEKEYLSRAIENNNYEQSNIFIHTTYINAPYEESRQIQDYYDYLKLTDEFGRADDI